MGVEKIKTNDIVITTRPCISGGATIPIGSYFIVKNINIRETGKETYNCFESGRIFDDSEIKLAKTFKLNDVVQINDTQEARALGYNTDETWRIIRVFVLAEKLFYDIESTKLKIHQQTIEHGDISGVAGGIEIGDRILILSNDDKLVYTVAKVYSSAGSTFYTVKEVDKSFKEKAIRIWEAKDERIRDKFYIISKLIRENGQKLDSFHMADDAKELNKQDRTILQSYYDDFMIHRILDKKTIQRLNKLYKENLWMKKDIDLELQTMENQENAKKVI